MGRNGAVSSVRRLPERAAGPIALDPPAAELVAFLPVTCLEIAVVVSSFERPAHLRRVLESIAGQRGVEGAFEVVVTDDGSEDETPELVGRFAESAPFPVHFTTHAHDGFQLARCRNEGVRATTAPYLLFLDGDCLIPPNHLRVHLDRRRERTVQAGYCVHLRRDVSEAITAEDVRRGNFGRWDTWRSRWNLAVRQLKAELYTLIRDPKRPKLYGGNIGIARADYERVNGYDENFRGWGCEDDDLRLRLRSAGIRIASILRWTHTYHLWHPKAPSAPRRWRQGTNVEYLHRPLRLTRCLAGLSKRRLQDMAVQVVGRRPPREVTDRMLPLWCRVAIAERQSPDQPAELEIAFAAGGGHFSAAADCRVLIVPRGMRAGRELAARADLVFADEDLPGLPIGRTFALSSLEGILQRQLGAPIRPQAPAQLAVA
jgi:glycosyltransferase involved in cell wall biosynthesis